MTTLTKNKTQQTTTKGTKTMNAKTKTAPVTDAPVTEEKTITPYDMCVSMHAKNMSDDDMISALAQHAGLSIMKAVAAFNNFKKKAGLVESKEDRTKRVNETIEDFVVLGEGEEKSTIDVKKAIAAVQDEMDIGPQSARKHVKAYCKTNDIDIPEIERGTPATEEQTAFVVAARKGGEAKKDTVAAFIAKWTDTTENRAKNIYAKACKDAGLTSDIAKYTMEEVAIWAKGETYEDDKALLAAFTVKFPEYSEHYAKKMVHMIRFATVYCNA